MKKQNKILTLIGILLLPLVWVTVKYGFNVEDRFLPSPYSLVTAFNDIEPNIFIHLFYTVLRLWVGFAAGLITGVGLGILLYTSRSAYSLLNSTFQSLRSVPATATIPFFLLWFGFSETGRFLIVIVGVSFNLAIATYQILLSIPDKYKVFFNSMNDKPGNYPMTFCLPFAMAQLLPTVRFSLSTAIGLIVVAEMLGSQFGLGYLIQTARSTFSMNVVFLATIFFGIINYLTDITLVKLWKKLIFWQQRD